jgi:hypothetical protein
LGPPQGLIPLYQLGGLLSKRSASPEPKENLMPQDMPSNPITPPYLTGVSATKGNGLFKLTPYTYPYQYSLTASQVNLQDTVTISNDADFVLQGLAIPSSAGRPRPTR